MYDTTSRRTLLTVGGAAALTALAGCSDSGSGADPDAIADDSRPSLGDDSAPVTVTVFEDFGCPACRGFKRQATPAIVQRYVEPGDVRYLHADFPIPVDEAWSYPVAGAARAVFEAAGNDAFWGFSSNVYEHQGSYSLDAIETVADDVAGVGSEARSAAEDGTYREVVEADRERGEEWGVSGTPSVFVDEEGVDPDLDAIDEAIRSRL